jgi:hypothetical protein
MPTTAVDPFIPGGYVGFPMADETPAFAVFACDTSR